MRFKNSMTLGLSILMATHLLARDASAIGGTGLSMSNAQQWGDHENYTMAGTSAQTGDLLGSALATGDFNGDGYDDLVVGTPGESGSANKAGEVHLLLGSEDGLRWWTQLNTAPNDGNQFGAAFAVGDFNDDGYDDLAVGEPGFGNGYGSVELYRGWWFGLAHSNTVITPGAAMRYGETLTAGDFDGDGNDDLAVGAPGSYWGVPAPPLPQVPMWIPMAGSVWIQWSGGMVGSNGTVDRERVYLGGINTRAGVSLAAFKDGLAIGMGSGAVRVLTDLGGKVSSGYAWDLHGLSPNSGWGSELVAGNFLCQGDVLGVGAPRLDLHPLNQGGGYLFPNAGGVTIKGSYGPEFVHPEEAVGIEHSRYGQVLGAGDFDRDGCEDLILGLPRVNPVDGVSNSASGSSTWRAGEVRVLFSERRYVPYGRTGFILAGLLDLDEVVLSRRAGHGPQPDGTLHYRLHNSAVRRAGLGSAVAAGDFDGDGFDDLAIGAPKDTVGSVTKAGSVQVVYGGQKYSEELGRDRPDFGRHETWTQR